MNTFFVLRAKMVSGDFLFSSHALAFFLLLFCACPQASSAIATEDPPFSCEYVPAEFEAGDIIGIDWYYGESSQQVAPTLTIHLVHTYEGFTIDPASEPTVSLTESWFCLDGNCESQIWIDHHQREIHLEISRTDGQAIGGHGLLAASGGIGVDIIDITRTSDVASLPVHFRLFPSPARTYVQVRLPDGAIPQKISILDIQGKLCATFLPTTADDKFPIQQLGAGMYVVRIISEERELVGRLFVRK
ncbi:MAG: T9SS type A sorting domain-containing protein [Bacteroidota bacterium]